MSLVRQVGTEVDPESTMPDSAPLISAVREEGGEVIGKGVVPVQTSNQNGLVERK